MSWGHAASTWIRHTPWSPPAAFRRSNQLAPRRQQRHASLHAMAGWVVAPSQIETRKAFLPTDSWSSKKVDGYGHGREVPEFGRYGR